MDQDSQDAGANQGFGRFNQSVGSNGGNGANMNMN
jgi:hypothetical protein